MAARSARSPPHASQATRHWLCHRITSGTANAPFDVSDSIATLGMLKVAATDGESWGRSGSTRAQESWKCAGSIRPVDNSYNSQEARRSDNGGHAGGGAVLAASRSRRHDKVRVAIFGTRQAGKRISIDSQRSNSRRSSSRNSGVCTFAMKSSTRFRKAAPRARASAVASGRRPRATCFAITRTQSLASFVTVSTPCTAPQRSERVLRKRCKFGGETRICP